MILSFTFIVFKDCLYVMLMRCSLWKLYSITILLAFGMSMSWWFFAYKPLIDVIHKCKLEIMQLRTRTTSLDDCNAVSGKQENLTRCNKRKLHHHSLVDIMNVLDENAIIIDQCTHKKDKGNGQPNKFILTLQGHFYDFMHLFEQLQSEYPSITFSSYECKKINEQLLSCTCTILLDVENGL